MKARGVAANIVLVSDHGMANVLLDRVIQLDLALPPRSFQTVIGGAVAGIKVLPGKDAEVAAALLKRHDHMTCWRKADIPARRHYGGNPRVPAFVCLADVGWMINGGPPRVDSKIAGMYGFDPAAPEMDATLVAAARRSVAGASCRLSTISMAIRSSCV